MADSLAGLVLAAGAGRRLRPLTSELPKPLCPVGDRALVDHGIGRLTTLLDGTRAAVADRIAVNVHHGAAVVREHLEATAPAVHVSAEAPHALGTAGAVGNLARWLDGRSVLVLNADTYTTADLDAFLRVWDRGRVSVLTPTPGDFGARSTVAATVIPGAVAARMPTEPAGLWEALWEAEVASGRLQTVHTDAAVLDCGTPARYLQANLWWAGGLVDGAGRVGSWVSPGSTVTGTADRSVVGAGAGVQGVVRRSVVWPGARVRSAEELTMAIRTPQRTVMVRPQRRLAGFRTGFAT